MSEPWFGPEEWWMYLPGPVLGSLAGLWGALCGRLLPRGKAKVPLWVSYGVFVVAGVGLLVTGLTALFTGQPYHVWYQFTLIGGLLTLLFVPFGVMLRRRWREIGERQMRAQEFDG